MLRAIVIGEGKLVLENFLKSLREMAIDVQIDASFSTVKESINHLSDFSNADIIFSDVKLPDGMSIEIFRQVNMNIPVIFVGAYDEFSGNWFKSIEYNYVGHIFEDLAKTNSHKSSPDFQMLEKFFIASNNSLKVLLEHVMARKKERLQVRKGMENILLNLQDIVLIYTESKMVFIIDNSGKKYFADKTLTDLELELDRNMFFRANRQYIVNIKYVKGFKAYEKVKLLVDLEFPLPPANRIIVSQKTAPAFKKWVYAA